MRQKPLAFDRYTMSPNKALETNRERRLRFVREFLFTLIRLLFAVSQLVVRDSGESVIYMTGRACVLVVRPTTSAGAALHYRHADFSVRVSRFTIPNHALHATAAAVVVCAFGFNRIHSFNRAVRELGR